MHFFATSFAKLIMPVELNAYWLHPLSKTTCYGNVRHRCACAWSDDIWGITDALVAAQPTENGQTCVHFATMESDLMESHICLLASSLPSLSSGSYKMRFSLADRCSCLKSSLTLKFCLAPSSRRKTSIREERLFQFAVSHKQLIQAARISSLLVPTLSRTTEN